MTDEDNGKIGMDVLVEIMEDRSNKPIEQLTAAVGVVTISANPNLRERGLAVYRRIARDTTPGTKPIDAETRIKACQLLIEYDRESKMAPPEQAPNFLGGKRRISRRI